MPQFLNFFPNQGDYIKSERLFRDVLSRLLSAAAARGEEEEERESNRTVSVSLKLAHIYGAWGQDDKAEKGFKFCIDTQDKKIARGTDRLTRNISNFEKNNSSLPLQSLWTRTLGRCWG